jgi:site-specific recombinase XerD
VTLVLFKCPQRWIELLTRQGVAGRLPVIADTELQVLLSITYGCCLRVREAVALEAKDIESERRLLRVA